MDHAIEINVEMVSILNALCRRKYVLSNILIIVYKLYIGNTNLSLIISNDKLHKISNFKIAYTFIKPLLQITTSN